MNIRFVEEAQQEFSTAISYYEEARAGLGAVAHGSQQPLYWILRRNQAS